MAELLQEILRCCGELQLFRARHIAVVGITSSLARHPDDIRFARPATEHGCGIQIKRKSISPNATSYPSFAELIGGPTETSPVVLGLQRMAKFADISPWSASVGCRAG